MAISQYDVKGIVNRAVRNEFGMHEFQRGFVWTPGKVRDLVESMYHDYPVGSLLLWYQQNDSLTVGRTEDSDRSNMLWIVDGQQRTTAMCLLFGRKPYWWQGDDKAWNAALEKFDIHVSPIVPDDPDGVKFETPKKAVINDVNYISVRKLLNADDTNVEQLTERLYENTPDINQLKVLRKLNSIRSISELNVSTFVVDKELEEVVEIFVRLNQTGTKVNEGDITRALVASRNPNWVNNTFEQFLDDLENSGFDLEPTLIFRSLIAASIGRTRFKDVDRDFWNEDNLNRQWSKLEEAWRTIISGLNKYGILNSDILPSKNVLIPPVVMAFHFEKDFRIEPVLAWLIRATCTNRYSRTSDTRLRQDIRFIRDSDDFDTAVQHAIEHLDALDFTSDDNEYFLKGGYRDDSVKLILYLLAYANKAHDWGASNDRIGFSGTDLLQKFNPDWHHIFPRAYLKKENAPLDIIDSAANIAAIRKETNLKIGKKSPMEYMEGISDMQLREQYVPTDRNLFTVDQYSNFIKLRAESLAVAANELIYELMK